MAPQEPESQEKYSSNMYKGLIRKNGQKWPPERYARMAIYVFLYNRISGKPTKWGLSDQDVSIQLKDAIENHWDELITEYIPGGEIHGINLHDPSVREKFVAESGSYNEHALLINPKMPSNKDMINFLQCVSEDKNAFYMSIHKSVQEKPGEWSGEWSDKDKSKNLIDERNKKYREIDKLQYDINKSTFWTAMKGGGTVASGGVTAVSAIMLFATPFPLNLIVGLGGGIGGIVGMRSLGSSFMSAFRENFKLRQKMRALKQKGGEAGKRGLKEIKDQIKFNQGLKAIMDNVGKIKKDGLPNFEEFVDYIKENYQFVYNRMKSGKYNGNFKKFYEESLNHYQTQDGGIMREVMEVIGRNEISVLNNDQIAIERKNFYEAEFNLANGISRRPEEKEDGYPKFNREDPIYSDEHQSLSNWIIWRNRLEYDKDTAFSKVPRTYADLRVKANRSFWSVFTDSVFNQEYSSGLQRDLDSYVRENGNEQVLEALKSNPDGDKTNIARNIVAFLGMEAKMDGDHALNGHLGVSITAQLVSDENFETAVSDGCEQIYRTLKKENKEKDYSGEKSIAIGFVNKIKTVLEKKPYTKKELSGVLQEITDSSINDRVKKYLKFMVEKKIDEASLGSNEIATEVINSCGDYRVKETTDISVLTSNTSYNDITIEISKLTADNLSTNYSKIIDMINKLKGEFTVYYNPEKNILQTNVVDGEKAFDYSKGLFDALSKQVESINIRETSKARADVLDAMKSGSFNANEDLKEIFEQIEKITFNQISNEYKSIDELYQKYIKKASPGIQKYLQMRFSNKIMMVMQDQLKNEATYTQDKENGMKNLQRDYTNLQGCVYLSLSQKKLLQSAYDHHIDIALTAEATKMQKSLFDGKSIDIIYDYQSRDLRQGGYRDYFQRHADDEATKKYQLYNTLLSKQKELFNFEYGAGKTEIGKDASADETRLITALLTTNDGKNINRPDNSKNDNLYNTNVDEMLVHINSVANMSRRSFSTISALKSFPVNEYPTDLSKLDDIKKNYGYNAIKSLFEPDDSESTPLIYLPPLTNEELENPEKYYNKIKNDKNAPTKINDIQKAYAELLILKRQIVTAIKGQIRELVESSGDPVAISNPRSYLMNHTDKTKMIKACWDNIVKKLDKKLNFCKEFLIEAGFSFNGASHEPAGKALALIDDPEGYTSAKTTSGYLGTEMSAS